MTVRMKDSEGNEIKAGDTVSFGYGIPPTGVNAKLIDRNGRLIALTPGHTPPECEVGELIKMVGYVCKVRKQTVRKSEIEANMFLARKGSSLK